jgi:N-methylhydantoinase A/oxoprolinase/acetone carboxylase beta subunit
LPKEPTLGARAPARPVRQQRVHLGEWREIDVLPFDALAPGQSIAGPALIEGPTTTVLVEAGDTARVLDNGWLDIRVG